MLVFDACFDFLPVDAEGRIGEHVVEPVGVQLVFAERVTQLDAADVLAFDQHVAFADRIALWVQFLTKGSHDRFGVQLVDVFHAAGKKPASSRRGVVDGADDARFGQGVVVFHEDQRRSQPDDVARGEVFSSGLVAGFRKPPDEFLKNEAHIVVADGCGAEVGLSDFLDDFVQQVGVLQVTDEFGEFEVFKDFAGVGREAVDVAEQVGFDVSAAHFGQVHLRGVIEGLLGGFEQEFVAGFFFQGFVASQLLGLGEDFGLGVL